MWLRTDFDPPPNGKIVMTKVDDDKGERNMQRLKRSGKLWFVPEGTAYVYYTPTHWYDGYYENAC